MTEKEAITLLKYLSNSFPNQVEFPTGSDEEDQVMVMTWLDWLGDYSTEQVKSAVRLATKRQPDFAPSPARLIRELDTSLSAEEAWEIYDEHVEAENLTEEEEEAIERAGSAVEFSKRDRLVGDQQHIRRAFIEQYNAIMRRYEQNRNLPETRNPLGAPDKQKRIEGEREERKKLEQMIKDGESRLEPADLEDKR